MVMLYDGVRGADKVSLSGLGATAALIIATGGIVPTSVGVMPIALVRLAPAAAVTGVILQQGLYNGQMVFLVNESVAASTITFAAAGTSFVADGAGSALAGVTGRLLVWDAAVSLWFRAA
jgi:hypothetical protein